MLTLEKYAGFVDKNKKIAIILMVFLIGFVVFLVWRSKRKWQPKRPDYPKTPNRHFQAGYHNGVDYYGAKNSPILAIEKGVVEVAHTGCVVGDDYYCGGQNGNYVLIDHKNGYKSYYLHLTTVVVKQGDKIRKGEILGSMGDTGHSRGAHLHLAVIKVDKATKETPKKTTYIDPETLFNS